MIYELRTEKRKYPFAIETEDGTELSKHMKYECAVSAENELTKNGTSVKVIRYK